MEESRLLILYDGYCNLCSWSVQWIIRNDPEKRFSFVPLQEFPGENPSSRSEQTATYAPSGQTAAGSSSGPIDKDASSGQAAENTSSGQTAENTSSGQTSAYNKDLPTRIKEMNEDSVILVLGDRVFLRSAAALRIAVRLRFPWPLLGIFFIIPRFLRDPVYRLVARYRKRWFGERASCYIP